jgi:hypothetical protein
MTEFTATKMEIEFGSTWTDVTADCRLPVEIIHGRKTPYDDISPSTMRFTLNNPVGDYTPQNTGSAHYPHVVKGARCRWTVTKGGVDYVRATMRIQRWQPTWPSNGDYRKGTVQCQAIDDLGILAQKKMRSNFTETVLWRAREDAVAADAFEATGEARGFLAFLTNYSEDASPGSKAVIYSADDPTLQFGSDNDLSCGGIVTANTGTDGVSCCTFAGFQASPKQIIFHFKTPVDLLDSSYWTLCTIYKSGGVLCHLIISLNGSDNGLFLMNSTQTTNLGLIADLPRGQWRKIRFRQNATTSSHMDVTCILPDGTGSSVTDVNLDIRTATGMDIPGGTGSSKYCSGSWGGIAALGTRTNISAATSFASGSGATIASRTQAIADMCERLPVTIAGVGTLTASVLTGDTSGRYAADVLREIARSGRGIVWARPRDSHVYVIGSDYVRPATPIATIDVETDCTGPPIFDDATDTQPTRVDVTWPGGKTVAMDAAAEAAGEQRSISMTTVCASDDAAFGVATAALAARSAGLRASKVIIDLVGAATDHTAAFFGAADTLEGLYPSARIRLALPLGMLGVATIDAYAEGWTELYDDGAATVTMDTSPAT